MFKKIIGVLFILAAVLMVVGTMSNGSVVNNQPSTAAAAGAFIGTIIPIALYVLSGILLITFDNICGKGYANGFKTRGIQCIFIIIFVCIYAFLEFGSIPASIEKGSALAYATSSDNGLLYSYLYQLPYILPLIVFIFMTTVFVVPYYSTKGLFSDKNTINNYLYNVQFTSCSKDNSVLISDRAFFFPKVFSVVPFESVESIEKYQVLFETGVKINTNKQKRISIMTKYHQEIIAAFEANKTL